MPLDRYIKYFSCLRTYKESDDESDYKSCRIIKTKASQSIFEIHNHMPVMLDPDLYKNSIKPID